MLYASPSRCVSISYVARLFLCLSVWLSPCRATQRSNAELDVVKIAASQQVQLARVQAAAVTQQKEAELQRDVEQKRIALETEKLRAREMSKAQVHAETIAKVRRPTC